MPQCIDFLCDLHSSQTGKTLARPEDRNLWVLGVGFSTPVGEKWGRDWHCGRERSRTCEENGGRWSAPSGEGKPISQCHASFAVPAQDLDGHTVFPWPVPYNTWYRYAALSWEERPWLTCCTATSVRSMTRSRLPPCPPSEKNKRRRNGSPKSVASVSATTTSWRRLICRP